MGAFDLELFEQLVDEYRSRPLREKPIKRDQKSQREKAEARIQRIQRELGTDFDDRVVLDLGCGHGWLPALLPELGGARQAIGVDPRRYETWSEHTDPRVRLIEGDLSADDVVEEESVDSVISGAVLEHVARPIEMLAAIHQVLKPGGRAWLYFNLYRGPSASHRYNEIPFPWPHLLFDDEICRAYYKQEHGRGNVPFAWVNRMTIGGYAQTVDELGFRTVELKRRVIPIDVGFYLRFEDELGRYPALDLETDFATLVLEKEPPRRLRKGRDGSPQELGYLERQRALDEAITAERAEA
ncbi:MAG TPA: class I SAM-dependent methyltransferase [Solirubrobacterales bacterium]|jgi:SAM-dependent methyltransferase